MKPYFEDGGQTIYHGRAEEIVPTLGRFDLLLTDPPYGIGADKKKAHSCIRDNPRWPESNWDDKPLGLGVINQVCSSARWQMIWGGNYFAGMPASSCWLVWRKPEAETGFSMADAELCWTNKNGAVRIWTGPRRDASDHPTQKPLALMKWCITQAPMDIQSVLDPFMGSGTTLVAAKAFGLRAVGIDAEEQYCAIAAERLRQSVLEFA